MLPVLVFLSKYEIAWNLFLLGIMGLPMVEEDGVAVAVAVAVVGEDIEEIEDLNLFQKNLRLQRLSVDFHQIRFKEILIWSSTRLRYNFIATKADKTTRHFAMFVISSVDSLKHIDDLRAMTSPWCRKSNKSKEVKLCSGCSKLWSNYNYDYFFKRKSWVTSDSPKGDSSQMHVFLRFSNIKEGWGRRKIQRSDV